MNTNLDDSILLLRPIPRDLLEHRMVICAGAMLHIHPSCKNAERVVVRFGISPDGFLVPRAWNVRAPATMDLDPDGTAILREMLLPHLVYGSNVEGQPDGRFNMTPSAHCSHDDIFSSHQMIQLAQLYERANDRVLAKSSP